MKPFDLEAAKRGKPIGYYYREDNIPQRLFVGVNPVNNHVVYVIPGVTCLQQAPESELRMLPEKVVRYGVIHEDRRGTYIASSLVNSPDALGPMAAGYHLARVEWEE